MKNLRRLGAAVVLTVALGFSAFAGQIPTDPCAPPEPGQIPTDPCAGQTMAPSHPTALGETNTSPSANAVDVLSVAKTAIKLLFLF